MGSNTPGRNAPCPCGSGKKYKKCCLDRDQQQWRADHPPVGDDDWVVLPNELDDLSNNVVRLIEQGRLDEADAACKELRTKYPDMVDGIERQAMVCEARGQQAEAARYYREAAAFARAHEGFEDEGIQDWLDRAQALDPV